jgi:type II secretory pathway component PulK
MMMMRLVMVVMLVMVMAVIVMVVVEVTIEKRGFIECRQYHREKRPYAMGNS